jgi:hypothetical protein
MLKSLELQLPFREQLPLDNGFPPNPVPSRFFWLCGECMKTYTMRRWTTSGLLVEISSSKFEPCPVLTGQESDHIVDTILVST